MSPDCGRKAAEKPQENTRQTGKDESGLFDRKFNKIKVDINKIKEYDEKRKGRERMTHIPAWIADLEDEDLAFIKKFILASGSLKEVAGTYGVSYPTVRLRLDRLIQKVTISETAEAEPYISLIKRLAVDDKLDFDTAKILITEYRKTKEGT